MENSRGFHHPGQRNFEKGGSGQGRMEPPNQGRAGMKEPTNHGGHTYEMGKTAAHNSNVDRMRSAHAGLGQGDHEKILHDTHKLHQGPYTSHGNKHGAAHHWRGEEGPAHERTESAAERRREGE